MALGHFGQDRFEVEFRDQHSAFTQFPAELWGDSRMQAADIPRRRTINNQLSRLARMQPGGGRWFERNVGQVQSLSQRFNDALQIEEIEVRTGSRTRFGPEVAA